jgi:hypothetical protein
LIVNLSAYSICSYIFLANEALKASRHAGKYQ